MDSSLSAYAQVSIQIAESTPVGRVARAGGSSEGFGTVRGRAVRTFTVSSTSLSVVVNEGAKSA
jgi:hypothetical protein